LDTWKGLFTEKEAIELVNCIAAYGIDTHTDSSIDRIRTAIDRYLPDHPLRDSITKKIEGLNSEQVNDIINTAIGISGEKANNNFHNLITTMFNPQEE